MSANSHHFNEKRGALWWGGGGQGGRAKGRPGGLGLKMVGETVQFLFFGWDVVMRWRKEQGRGTGKSRGIG